ncbi:MAG TPA: PilZ domain-containing protein [Sphingobium sp.]|uniref:PilZ domain-containing protein n=1 Tax=Sphingobium sp. TaxID=1912891 RepID=UPI002ED1EF1D
MDIKRKRARIVVDITVTLTTVLDSLDARIIDLSEHGAQIVGAAMATGAKFQIEYMGQTVYAQCMWSEVDRMGVRFPFDLADGPLHDALMMAMPSRTSHGTTASSGFMPPSSYSAMTPRRFGTTGFGRRAQA